MVVKRDTQVSGIIIENADDFYESIMSQKHHNQAYIIEILKAYNDLPEGWSRNPDKGAPFIHVDGRESWKNPSRDKIQKILDEAASEDQNQKIYGSSDTLYLRCKLKKYRMMIKSGVAIGAVVCTAQREGVDPALIDTSICSPVPTKLNKYQKMLKCGISLEAVENAARRDGVDPSVVLATKSQVSSSSATNIDTDRALKKYKKMLNCGVAMGAIEQLARIEGVVNESVVADLVSAASDTKIYFKPAEKQGQIEFNADFSKSDKSCHLAFLVRKLAQTVHKRGGGALINSSTGHGSVLTVDIEVLYNALGSFLGVQHARDAYNSTCQDSTLTENEVRAMRKPFLEHLSSLGIRPPTKKNAQVDIEGLDDLIQFIKKENKTRIHEIDSDSRLGMYTFDSLSQIYTPGNRVVAKNTFASGVDMICQVSWNRYEQGRTLFGTSRTFKVCFQFVAAVGKHFTICEFVDSMANFEGRRSLKSLPFIPLSAYSSEEKDRLTKSFRLRGQMYSKYANSANFLAYGKGAFYAKAGRGGGRDTQTAATRNEGRVMIDTQGAYDAGYSISIGNDSMVMCIKQKHKEYMLHMRALKQASAATDNSSSGALDEGMILFDSIPRDYLDMTWPAVIGFSFASKVWGDILVEGLHEIRFNRDAFENLVLPAARKRMVKALVRNSSDAFSDIISGKGEGSVFLLYGPPGVGKTLTAEAISEMLQRPLYSVSLGQLGLTPAELETKLGEILDLCSKWDALILLDEADIFLEKRSSVGSLERNAMVSVMLRLVEYFKGVLFLTSNRVDSLDPAFKTRITLALRYDSLDAPARKQVWINLLKASGLGDRISTTQNDSYKSGMIDPESLARHILNGREIKNAIRLSLALAKEDDKPLTQTILEETVEILKDFNEKLNTAEVY